MGGAVEYEHFRLDRDRASDANPLRHGLGNRGVQSFAEPSIITLREQIDFIFQSELLGNPPRPVGIGALPEYGQVVEYRALKDNRRAAEISDMILVARMIRFAQIMTIEKHVTGGRPLIAAKKLCQN